MSPLPLSRQAGTLDLVDTQSMCSIKVTGRDTAVVFTGLAVVSGDAARAAIAPYPHISGEICCHLPSIPATCRRLSRGILRGSAEELRLRQLTSTSADIYRHRDRSHENAT